jgi:hypothetical protein
MNIRRQHARKRVVATGQTESQSRARALLFFHSSKNAIGLFYSDEGLRKRDRHTTRQPLHRYRRR